MKFQVAKRSISILLITSLVVSICAVLFLYSNQNSILFITAFVLAVLLIICYLTAPASYQIQNGNLIIWKNFGKKEFPNVINCYLMHEKPSFTVRVFGNGGVFAGTGIFWNKKFGFFKAYVTTGKTSNMVIVDTEKETVIISPINPNSFIEYWEKFE